MCVCVCVGGGGGLHIRKKKYFKANGLKRRRHPFVQNLTLL